jgi:hypothetical protein
MNLDEDKLYIKIVALNGIYNFVVDDFWIWKCLGSRNIILSTQIFKFQV